MRSLFLSVLMAISGTSSAQIYTQVTTYAGNGADGLVDGPLASAEFSTPYSLCYDGLTNTIYVADAYNNCIRKITGGVVSTLAGNGNQGDVDAQGSNARFYLPTGIDFYNGNVYVCDNGNHKIKMIDAAGNVTTIAGTGAAGTTNGPALSAKFYNPTEVRVSALGVIFISDYGNDCIRKLDGGVVSTFAGLAGSTGDALGTGTAARFNRPTGIAFANGIDLLVADQVNCKIKKITPAGVVTLLAGSGATATIDGVGASAAFMRPTYVGWDAYGGLMVGEWMGNVIRYVTLAGSVTTIAGTGVAGYIDGPPSSAEFNAPYGVCADNDGNAYIGDKFNHVVRKLYRQPDGILTPTPTLPLPLHPNPTTGQVFLDLSGISDAITGVLVYDEAGALVLSQEGASAAAADGTLMIDASGWAAGRYAVLVTSRSRVYRSTFVR